MIRNTIQRAVVYETVHKLKNHASADEVYTEIIKTHPHISKGTVYRNLQRLCEEGKIKRRRIPGEADRFDHECSEHYHIKCIHCGKLQDVELMEPFDMKKQVGTVEGFEILGHELTFYGICDHCKEMELSSAKEERLKISDDFSHKY